VQRNRSGAELVRFRVGEEDRTETNRAALEARQHNTVVTTQAVQVDSAGQLRRPLGEAREWPSKMLWGSRWRS
jgi:hypothetical protein